jgi:hypothetical protein
MPKPFRAEIPRPSIKAQAADGSGSAHVRVAAALMTKSAFWAMSWNEHRVIPHRPQTLRDARNQGVVVALRKVSAANAACKQNITDKRAFDFS